MFKELFQLFREELAHLLRLGEDSASEEEVIQGIERGVEFRGAKLWILVIAVFVASLGLNTNSAAVIIGAMLISPLMGPIIGMGLGAGIYDFELLRRSWRNFIVATVFSVITATFYFLITPIAEAQSELLARTSPTIYDVLIALCGGLAGIIALSSRSQRTGNVIPGVAIATALMPPLCTVGFGIATANWTYAAGAMYLFTINTIFIALATFIGAVFIMRFTKKSFIDPVRERKVKRVITAVVVVTVIPSVILTFGMVQQSYFEQHVNKFIHHELSYPTTQVVSHRTDFSSRSFNVVMIGAELDSATLQIARERLPLYNLEGVDMQVLQGTGGTDSEEFQNLLMANNTELHQDEAIIAQQKIHIAELEFLLHPYQEAEALAPQLLSELQMLFPEVTGITVSKGISIEADTIAPHPVTMIMLKTQETPDAEDTERLTRWLEQRTQMQNLQIRYE